MPPDHLFKYATADTARAILDNQTLQWSSPVAFNDPFDLKNYFYVDFSWSDLQRDALNGLQDAIYSPQEPILSVANEFAPHIRSFSEGEVPALADVQYARKRWALRA